MLEALLGGFKPKTKLLKLTGVIPVTDALISSASFYTVSSALINNVFYLAPFNRAVAAVPFYKLNQSDNTLSLVATGLSSWNNTIIYQHMDSIGVRGLANGNATYRLLNPDTGTIPVNGSATEMICMGMYPTYGDIITIKNGNTFYAIGVTTQSGSGAQGYLTRYAYTGTTYDTNRTTLTTSGMLTTSSTALGFISWLHADRYVYTLFANGRFTRFDSSTGAVTAYASGPVDFSTEWITTIGKRGAVIGNKLYFFHNASNTLYYFDVTSGTWKSEAILSDLSTYKYAAHVMNGPNNTLIIHPGWSAANVFSKDLFVYTPAA